MAVGKAAVLGATAAIGVPLLLRQAGEATDGWLQTGLSRFTAAGYHIEWSWPVFGIVTLFAFGFLAWAEKR